VGHESDIAELYGNGSEKKKKQASWRMLDRYAKSGCLIRYAKTPLLKPFPKFPSQRQTLANFANTFLQEEI
jgi:hypothetical protein